MTKLYLLEESVIKEAVTPYPPKGDPIWKFFDIEGPVIRIRGEPIGEEGEQIEFMILGYSYILDETLVQEIEDATD